MKSSPSFVPFPLIALALIGLLSALWAGLIRLGWGWPVLQPTLPLSHGPLMISGFLGTVIGIERAVALLAWLKSNWGRRLVYVGPVCTALGTLALVVGLRTPVGPLLMTLGSLGLVFVFGLILRRQFAVFTITMTLAALIWFVGNGLWLLGRPIYTVVLWWSSFLILTIAGERLELNRVLRLSGVVQNLFMAAVGLNLAGLVVLLFEFDLGVRLTGLGLLVLALWLLRYDIARHTVKKSGLTRFMAYCLLVGYGWLGVGGVLAIIFGGVTAGFYYDALHHAVFVGFVMSMIFAHAPIIFPAISGRAIPFRTTFYVHLILLHLSLLLRIVGDLTLWPIGRQWGGLLNVVALLLFLGNTAWAVSRAQNPPAVPVIPSQKVA